jgi:site-specific recombinase XerD
VLTGVRPSTLRAKLYVLTAFARQLAPRDLADATRADAETFLTSRPLKPESRRAYRSALRGLYAWAADEGLIPADPTARIPAIRVPKAVPRPIIQVDLDRALSLGDSRMRAWLLLMALGGLPCIEVAGLRPEGTARTRACRKGQRGYGSERCGRVSASKSPTLDPPRGGDASRVPPAPSSDIARYLC